MPGDQFVLNFGINIFGPDGAGYRASAVPVQNLEIKNDPKAFTIITSADDESVAVNLGTNTFTFYGTTYTGSQLFVSSNGLITFGSGNAEASNSDLSSDPTQTAIAPLWADWITGTGHPMILGKFVDLNGDGIPDELILEWNQVWHYLNSPSGITFQAVLSLNTGPSDGNIVFNYQNLNTGDSNANGATATVGIKAANTPGANRLLLSYNNGSNPFVQTGTAILITSPPLNFAFDASFNANGGTGPSPTQAVPFDYTSVVSTPYSPTLGYGWLNTPGNYDRGAATLQAPASGVPNFQPLLESFNDGSDNTFRVDLQAGTTYTATVTMGDTRASHGPVDIFTVVNGIATRVTSITLGDGTVVSSIYSPINQFLTGSFQVTAPTGSGLQPVELEFKPEAGVSISSSTPWTSCRRRTRSPSPKLAPARGTGSR